MAAQPLAMCYPGLAGGTLRGRLTPRFRTIQVWPKDLPSVLRQVESAVNRKPSPAGWPRWRRRHPTGEEVPMSSIKRRQFISLLGGGAATWPLAAQAQQAAMPVIGVLSVRSPSTDIPLMTVIRRGLSETGFVEGQNVVFDYRHADDQLDRLPALAADLVHRRVMVMLTMGGESVALAAKAATTTVPIVSILGTDGVQAGLVASVARPGGNLTGVSSSFVELEPKRLELIRELLPKANTIALLVNPNEPFAGSPVARAAACTSLRAGRARTRQARPRTC